MILTGENCRTGRQTCPSARLNTTILKWTVLGSKPGPSGDRPANNLRNDIRRKCAQKYSPYHAVNTARVHDKTTETIPA